MSNYMLSNDSFYEIPNDELMHYGVVGMKWGVRRNPAKAYERASKKMTKLNAKAEKAKIKYGKKSGVHLTDFGIAAERKARKKSARATAKAILWQKAMDKEFSATKLSALEEKYVGKGADYIKKMGMTTDSTKQSAYSDKASKYYTKSDEVRNLRERLHNNN